MAITEKIGRTDRASEKVMKFRKDAHLGEKNCKKGKAKLPGNHLVLTAPVILNKENNISHLHLLVARHLSQHEKKSGTDEDESSGGSPFKPFIEGSRIA